MSRLMILGAGPYQIPAIRTAQDTGHVVVTLSNRPGEPGKTLADKGFDVSTTDRGAVLDLARREKIDGIMTMASEASAPTAAFVAAHMGLPGTPLAVAETISDKYRLRSVLRDAGIGSVRFREAAGSDDVRAFLDETGTPVMIKPMNLSGSRGVVRIDDPADADVAFAACRAEAGDGPVLVEEFVEGPDLGGECLLRNGAMLFGELTDKRVNRHFVPVVHHAPAGVDAPTRARCLDLVARAAAALGFRDGVLDFDLRLGADGPVLLELGGRLGGNGVPQVLHAAHGVDLIANGIRYALGEEPEVAPGKPRGICTVRLLGSDRAGRVVGLADPAEVVPPEDQVEIVLDAGPGDRVEVFDQGAHRLGHVIYRSADRAIADQRAEALAGTFTVEES